MVKLRSRLIRSPFSGGASAGGDSNSTTSPAVAISASPSARFNGINQQRQGGGIGRANNHHARQQHQRQRQVNRRRNNQGLAAHHQRRSQRSRMNESNGESSSSLGHQAAPAAATSTAAERRPFESLGSSLQDSPAFLRGASASSVTSPGKRKPESRGITASIRRAKSAMFRIASSPMTSSSSFHSSNSSQHNQQPLGGDATSNAQNNAPSGVARAPSDEMDTSEDVQANASHASPARASPAEGQPAVGFQRNPSEEENVPPMALLSPNCGTCYAHAAGAASAASFHNHNKEEAEAFRDQSSDEVAEEDMEVDNLAVAATSTTAPANAALTTPAVAPPRVKNVLEWMREDAPPELLPRLLSFCGSRRMCALSKANKAWNAVMKDESVWKVLCEDTHKWSDGDEVPNSWSQLYKQNPCVPIDYDTIDAAFDSVSSGSLTEAFENNVTQVFREQRQTCRILLHPGPYFLRRPLVANVAGSAEVTIESLSGGEGGVLNDPEHGMIWQQNYHDEPSMIAEEEEEEGSERDGIEAAPGMSPARAHFMRVDERRPSTPTLRQIFGSCSGRTSSSMFAVSLAGLDRASSSGSGGGGLGERRDHDEVAERSKLYRAAFLAHCLRGTRPTALICLETRSQNEPAVRVRRGTLNLLGLKILHYSEGTDIWNGNAAVQVQAAFGSNGRPLRIRPPAVPPTANVIDCDVTSLSGRGLVAIDGGVSHVRDCNLHDSAATGIYVGGAGSVATMVRTDVVDNGVGNVRNPRRGVARGHSGVYVEQGLCKILDCNISRNTLTGISAISTEQARLHLEESDVMANRSDQVELPPAESGRGVNRNNGISAGGRGRPRSRHLADSEAARESHRRSFRMPSTPQSPLESAEG